MLTKVSNLIKLKTMQIKIGMIMFVIFFLKWKNDFKVTRVENRVVKMATWIQQK